MTENNSPEEIVLGLEPTPITDFNRNARIPFVPEDSVSGQSHKVEVRTSDGQPNYEKTYSFRFSRALAIGAGGLAAIALAGCGGNSCFPAGTMILMADGSKKKIEDVKVDDEVMGHDGEKNVPVKVLELESPVRDHMHTLEFENGTKLQLTREHPLFTKEGWKSLSPEATAEENAELKVSELKKGDRVLNESGNFVAITNITLEEKEIQTYNLKKVSDYNNFFADEYLAHNKGKSCFPAGTPILMSDGSEKKIEDVKVDDEVMGHDGEKNVPVKVLELESPVRDHMHTLEFENGTKLQLTREHPLFTKEGWKSLSPEATAEENAELNVKILKQGDEVLNKKGDYVKITNITLEEKEIQTYNLKKVSGHHNFFANGYLAHNKDKDKDKDDKNHAPVITTTTIAEFEEDVTGERTINFSDPDGDNLNVSLTGEVPPGMTVTKLSNTQARLTLTGADEDADKTYNLIFTVSDGKKATSRTIPVYLANTTDLKITVKDAETNNGLTGAQLTLDNGAGKVYTGESMNPTGLIEIDNVRDGAYSSKLEHLAATHQTCQLGTANVSKLSNDTATEIIYQDADSTEVNDVLRRHGAGLAKYLTKPTKIRIYTLEEQTGNPVAGATVTSVSDIFTNEANQFTQNKFNFAAGDLEIINEKYPGGEPPEGYICVYWDSTMPAGAGGNTSWLNGNEVKKSAVILNTSAGKPVQLQEIMECFLGSSTANPAETDSVDWATSVFYNPGVLPKATSLSSKDIAVGRLAYSDAQRAGGSTSPDNNPTSFDWLATHTAPAAIKLYKPAFFKLPSPDDSDCPDEDYSEPYALPPKEPVKEVF